MNLLLLALPALPLCATLTCADAYAVRVLGVLCPLTQHRWHRANAFPGRI